eukprot:1158968-Pelagomonas_calceolata.AAC.2
MERLRSLAAAAPFTGSAIRARDPESVVPKAQAKDKSIFDYLAASSNLVRCGPWLSLRMQPALKYFLTSNLAASSNLVSSGPWLSLMVQPMDPLRVGQPYTCAFLACLLVKAVPGLAWDECSWLTGAHCWLPLVKERAWALFVWGLAGVCWVGAKWRT